MDPSSFGSIIEEQMKRALWETRNLLRCVPDALWRKEYCGMPLWKHIYHTLHSLDLWLINPRDENFAEPSFHIKNLNNLDAPSLQEVNREQMEGYLGAIQARVLAYLSRLQEDELLQNPPGCEYTRFTLIMAQTRHLHCHLGMMMGFLICDEGKWPLVLGLEGVFPDGDGPQFYE